MSKDESESIKHESEPEEDGTEKYGKNKDKYEKEEDDEYKSEEDDDYNFEQDKKPKKKIIGNKRKRDVKKKKKKKERNAKNYFVEDEAEENEEDESFGGGEITKEQYEKLNKMYDQRHFNQREKQLKITDENEEEIAKRYDERVNEQDEDEIYDNIDKMPTSNDPKLWLLKCKIGEEKEILANLYHKYFYFKNKEPKDRLKIFSIISYDNLKGKIYIEAFSERDIMHAISGMSNVNPNSLQIIPIDERVKIFEYDRLQRVDINNNQLVRIKHGNYEGDLAKVVYIEDAINKIYIALIPRINDIKNQEGFNVAPFSKQRSVIRPRQKLFDNNKIHGVDVITCHEPFGDCQKLGKYKFKDGLLIKSVRISSLETENIYPKEEELQNLGCYKDDNGIYRDKNEEQELIISNKEALNITYKPGDNIRLVEGDLKDITGTVLELKDNKIIVKLNLKESGEYAFSPNMITISFKLGEIVYAKKGVNKGKSGIVIKYIDNNNYVIYDEITQTKFTAKNTDLALGKEMKFDSEENTMFKIGDLVHIKNSNIICYVIESSKFILKVVTTRNEVKKLSSREVEKVSLIKKTTYVDGKGFPIAPENTVKVINGKFKGNKGTIKCIYNKYVFLHNNIFNRTNGIFCELNDNLELLGSELFGENSEKGKVNYRRVPNDIKDLIGKVVHVIEGTWKGYNGILIGANDKSIKLELSAKQKTIQLPFNYIKAGDVSSAKENEGQSHTPTNITMKTPAYYEVNHHS